MTNKQGYIYILSNYTNSTLYIGVTSNIQKRVFEHKNKVFSGFSDRYNLNKLVYYECYDSIVPAIEREKYLKGKTRAYKDNLITAFNPTWKDLYNDIL